MHLTIINWNVNSISKRYPLIIELINNYRPDIITLQETRADLSKENLTDLKIIGYEVIQSSHIKGRNGVLTLISNAIIFTKLNRGKFESEINQGRIIEGVLWFKGRRLLLSNVYVHQGASYMNGKTIAQITNPLFDKTIFNQKLDFLRKIGQDNGFIDWLIAGDLNVVYKESDSWHFFYNQHKLKREIVSFTQEERDLMSRAMLRTKEWSYDLTTESYDFTWYDYRNNHRGGLDLSRGMKIDYCLMSKNLKAKRYQRLIDFRTKRKPTSDHIPLLYHLEILEF